MPDRANLRCVSTAQAESFHRTDLRRDTASNNKKKKSVRRSMLFDLKHGNHLDRLMEQLRFALVLTPDLLSNVISDVCTRLPVLRKAGKTAQIDRLIEARAWSDVALALIEIELPTWKLRRLIYEDGEWFCSLSKQPSLPVDLDDTADARHDVLPLAIISAFVEARGRTIASHETGSTTVPQIWPVSAARCDKFT